MKLDDQEFSAPMQATLPYPEDMGPDPWPQLWGEPVLQELGRWLTDSASIALRDAVPVVDAIWVAYSYVVIPHLPDPSQMAIAVREPGQEDRPLIALLPHVGKDDAEASAAMRHDFQEQFATPLRPVLKLVLKPLAVHAQDDYVTRASEWCSRHHAHLLGIFDDRLEEELETLMGADEAAHFLATPNIRLHGRTPREVLNTPHDRIIRDLILAEKHSQPQWG